MRISSDGAKVNSGRVTRGNVFVRRTGICAEPGSAKGAPQTLCRVRPMCLTAVVYLKIEMGAHAGAPLQKTAIRKSAAHWGGTRLDKYYRKELLQKYHLVRT